MSKQSDIARYLLIIKKLKADKYSSFAEISKYLHQQSGSFLDDDIDFLFSRRTFQRIIREIKSLFGIIIESSKLEKAYFISSEPDNSNYFLELAEYSNFLNTLKYANDISKYIAFERTEDKGSQFVALILKAIHNRRKVEIAYLKFTETKVTTRKVAPLGLKQHRGRWYLIAKDTNNSSIKCFGLDRVKDIDFSNDLYDYPLNFTLNEYFKYSFGIYRPVDKEPVDVVLSFQALKGQYIKTYPLHHTQQIISENNEEVLVKLFVYITPDFIMELMSHSNEMKVISPKQLLTPYINQQK